MTNFEKFKDDLLKIEGEFAFNKNTRKLVRCDHHIECEDCIFFSRNCAESDKVKWLYEECKEPIISNGELELIKALGKVFGRNYKYIARDAFGIVRLFENKPSTNKTGNYSGAYTYVDIAAGDKVLFPNIKFTDGVYDIENKCFIKEEGED